MKRIFLMIFVMSVILNSTACSTMDEEIENSTTFTNNGNDSESNNTNENPREETMVVKISFGSTVLKANFVENATTRSFMEMLPLTLPMQDLYFREMCYRFPDPFPAEEVVTRGYDVGEIIYYPPRHSFVIMYTQNQERFSMQSMGVIESGVEDFRNIGDVEVRFEKWEEEPTSSIKPVQVD